MKEAAIRKISTQAGFGARGTRQVGTWTRRLHFYLGLYLLLFIWLFSISGLLLNNSDWKLTLFWDQREESSVERVITPPLTAGDLAMAKELMRELGIVGEIQEITRGPADEQFRFQVGRPGQTLRVDASFSTRRASVTQIDASGRGVLNALHTFTGVSMNNPGLERDWLLTRIWSLAMDAVAVGLMILVFSGLYLWYRLKKKRLVGAAVLGLGIASCGFFLIGLAHVL